jgi:hypothetical protein
MVLEYSLSAPVVKLPTKWRSNEEILHDRSRSPTFDAVTEDGGGFGDIRV